MEEAEPEQQPKDEELEKETTSKPMSEGSSPDEDDFFARSSKYYAIYLSFKHELCPLLFLATSLMQELQTEKEKNLLESSECTLYNNCLESS